MPVVNIISSRLRKLIPGIGIERILETLPYAGLDIEGMEGDVIRVEYNPNRPDFSSDFGIARALRGLLRVELGMPSIKISRNSGATILIDRKVKQIRPHVGGLIAKDGKLDDETIKQLIAMQEDLHNGIGRRREKASIGIHSLDAIRFPITYTVGAKDYSFTPLGETSSKAVSDILEYTESGRQYGHILEEFGTYPLIVDKEGTVLSLPPIINGNATKVTEMTRDLFVEVTATDSKASIDILAIIAMALHDAGFRVSSVAIRDGGRRFETPLVEPTEISAELTYINSVLGLSLDSREAINCLRRSRLDAKAKRSKIRCVIPRYRTDISDPIDITEEVAIGYGIRNFKPTIPPAIEAGRKSPLSGYLARIREVLAALGLIETIRFSLTGHQVLYSSFERSAESALAVDGSKSSDHEILRDSLIPSLLESLSRNVHEEYPQRLFEIGKTFHKDGGIAEKWGVSAVTAHSRADYTEIKAFLQALMSSCFRQGFRTEPARSPFFIEGRSAAITIDGRAVGGIGEVIPLALENHNLRVPAAAFEIELGSILNLEQ